MHKLTKTRRVFRPNQEIVRFFIMKNERDADDCV